MPPRNVTNASSYIFDTPRLVLVFYLVRNTFITLHFSYKSDVYLYYVLLWYMQDTYALAHKMDLLLCCNAIEETYFLAEFLTYSAG